MDIRSNRKYYHKLIAQKTNLKGISFNLDENIEVPIVMISKDGKLVEYLKGYKVIKSFLKYGYVRIAGKCPLRHRKCIAEKCSFYYIENGTGDCVYIWRMFKGN